ncbi:MAG: helix-turn-helix transcriptional regulator [Nitrosomonas sp.]|nr:helix-turn-helix transcriptional regulator [Nitrosomonas sp.]
MAREKLEQEGRTTKWLANEVGLDIKSLGNVLRGRKPSLPVIKLMALKLGVSEHELLRTPPQSAS